MDEDLTRLQEALSEEEWQRRVVEADRQALVIERVEMHNQWGMSLRAAIRREMQDEPETTWLARHLRYQRGGINGLIDRSIPVRGITKNSDELVSMVRTIAVTLEQMGVAAFSPIVGHHLQRQTGTSFSGPTVRRLMKRAGVQKPTGRPQPQPHITAHPLAGTELLLAIDQHLGATDSLSAIVLQALEQLQQPDAIEEDTDNRDAHGRFTTQYNQLQQKKPTKTSEPTSIRSC